MSDIESEEEETLDESNYNTADELARLEEEALEAQYSTPQQAESEDNTDMLVDDVQRALKRTKDELYEAMNGDGSQNPEVARRLFFDANGNGDVAGGVSVLLDKEDPEL